MKFPPFELERIQSLYENSVEVNLTESGVEPLSLKELMNAEELEELINIPIGYGYTQGSPLLRQRISNLYKEYDEKNVLVTSGSSEAIFLSA
ncbi:MAG TPA: aspartate aminotransferase, partial [Gammaproteobacteria bacterium]|nr:aspartate aminotransferase [Gammaproteobacteria bacterium]